MAESLRRRGIKFHCDLAQHRITRIVVGRTTLRDSYALLPFSLDELASLAGEAPPSLPWSCMCGRNCGGYCRLSNMAKGGDPDLDDYCVADCRVLYKVIRRLMEHATKYGIDLRGTLGATAWATAQRDLELPDADLPWEVWRRVRRADKGGRLTIGRRAAKGPGAHFDIVNAYPGALARCSVPIGEPRELGGRNAKGALHNDRAGLYTCTVTVPEDSFLPPLAWRYGGRMNYPTGTFSGSWTLPELIFAIERGTTVDKVHSAIVWEHSSPLFAELMRSWYSIRHEVGKNTPLGSWQSRLAKALTGKFAEQPDRERIVGHPDKIRVCLREGRCRRGCTRRCGAYAQMDLMGYIWSAPYWKLAPSGHAHWSAYLRAETRCQWLEAAERYQPGELVYGDTDSIWVTGKTTPLPMGEMLGQWELKHAWSKMEIRAPKVYRFRDGSGRTITRGAPGLTDEDWRRGNAVIDRGVMTLRQAVGGKDGQLFKRRHRQWTLPGHDTDPIYYGDRKLDPVTGITYPLSAREHRDRLQDSSATAPQEEGRKEALQG